jgi:hypothetical protein
MTIEVKINCDHCKTDLRYTSYAYEYRITLTDEAKENNIGIAYASGIPRHIAEDKHFCNLKCLKEWVNK